MRELIARTVRDGDTCLDIGAQKGYVSLTLAKAVGSKGRVLAFEPTNELLRNSRRTSTVPISSVIEVFHCALGEREGSCTFVLSKVLGWSSRFPNELAKTAIEETVEVKVNSLDEMIARKEIVLDASRLSFIKLDAEGSEPFILRGMSRLYSPRLVPYCLWRLTTILWRPRVPAPRSFKAFFVTSNWTFTNRSTTLIFAISV